MDTAPNPQRGLRAWSVAASLVVLACVAVYANSLHGDFIYDDVRQILGNHLVQQDEHVWQALTSDVWAFKGTGETSWSNYWRPTFVAWLQLGVRVFGLESTLGWHLGNLGLHALACVLALLLLKRLRVPLGPAVSVSLLFAVHPVHVESVAWISGSPDLLLATTGLGALLLHLHGRRIPALILFALSLGSKEVAVLLPVVMAGATLLQGPGPAATSDPWVRRAWTAFWPYGGLAALYLVARHLVLGRVQVETPWMLSPVELLLNVPQLLLFYLRQVFWPFWLGPSYPLRAHQLGDATGRWLGWEILAVVLLAGAAIYVARRYRTAGFGFILFLLVLLPAFNVNAFLPEQLVHDRYLYLPLLGLLLAVVLPLHRWLRSYRRLLPAALAVFALYVAALSVETVRYNRVWRTELSLWERAVARDPTSAYNWAHYGIALKAIGQQGEAAVAFDRALRREPVTAALLGRAELRLELGQLTEAEHDLRRVANAQPGNAHAHELLAMALSRQGRSPEAMTVLEEARDRILHRRCSLTTNLAVLRYVDGDKESAQQLLLEAEALAPTEPSHACLVSIYHLGSLYREHGDIEAAVRADRRFLERTQNSTNRQTLEVRRRARQRSDLDGFGETPDP